MTPAHPRWLAGRRGALGVASLLMIAACSGSSADTTTTTTTPPGSSTTTAPNSTTSTGTVLRVPEFPDDDEAIPTDGAVRIGTLGNGLTYYVRENAAPGGRAQLRLAVQAGSIQEDPGQRGAAHFLEHMMFNGTARYPANELITVLQRFGAEFGPDINAYTSYEETVYELELPTDEDETLAAGFDVLYEWATAVTLDPAEVDRERGVLVEEWRLRDQGFWGRYFAAVTEELLADTDYEDREPLGTPDEVANTTPDGLRAFYETWYRPETMAVIAVGDFDADTVERLIADRFGGISAAEGPPVPSPTTAASAAPSFVILRDPETVQTWAELNYPLPAEADVGTVGTQRRSLALRLAWTMIVTRLDEESLRGEVPFWDPSFAANPLVRRQQSPGVAAYTDPDDLATATEHLLRAVGQARAHGFTQAELDRALADLRSEVQLAYDERATTQDEAFAGDYVDHFLGGVPIPSADDWFDLQLRLLDEMTADQVWHTFGATVGTTEPLVIVVAPATAAGVPDEAALAEITAAAAEATYEPWVDQTEALATLMERPDAVSITNRGLFSDTGLTEVTLANGARVAFLPTSIRDDVVVFRAASPGGWAPLPAADVAEAQLAADIVLNSGVGSIDQVTLDRTLSGASVTLTPYISEVEEGFFGEAATSDIEILLQLVHLYMTEPRLAQVGLDIAVAENLPFAAHPEQVPELAVAVEAADARFAGDPRFGVVPPAADLMSLELERAAEIFGDRFDDPGDFVFVFAGDFDEDQVEDLARRYLGTIPGPGDAEEWENVRPDPPQGVVRRVVEAGTGRLGGLTLLFSTEYPLDGDTRIAIDLLRLVLQQRLTERIREELSASYSPFAYVELVEAPEESVELWVQISGDPDGLDAVSAETLAVLASLRASGPSTDELAIASEQLLRDYELLSNEALADAMVFSALHADEGLSEIVDRIDRTFDPTRSEIRDLARDLMPPDRYIEIRLVPLND